jgi:hypothetical protein
MNILLRMYPGDAWAFLIANVIVQVTVVILTARLLARLGSRWNAAWRHSVYLVAILCVLASPVLSWLMQTTGITLVTLRPAVTTVRRGSPDPAVTSTAGLHRPTPATTPTGPQLDNKVGRVVDSSAAFAERKATMAAFERLPFSDIFRAVGGLALLIWLLGVVLLLVRWC